MAESILRRVDTCYLSAVRRLNPLVVDEQSCWLEVGSPIGGSELNGSHNVCGGRCDTKDPSKSVPKK